jgi:lipocalin-like protein
MRNWTAAILPFVLTAGLSEAWAQSVPPEHTTAAKPTRQAIIGAWRLAEIDYSGPKGALPDPVFGPNPQGILIYDQSGWMSVQIVTANRPAMTKPASRTSHVLTLDDAKLAIAAFDTYYAYFGNWDFDAGTSIVTHHLTSSLLPYETGLEYRREVRLDGAQLRLTARLQEAGEERTRSLLWTRISDPALAAAAPPAYTESSPPPSVAQSRPLTPAREAAAKYGDMPADYEKAIRKYFQEHLKYPDSVQYQEITKPLQGYTTAVTGTFLMRETRVYGWLVKATINAKNSHDGYTGFKTYTFLFRGENVVDTRAPLPGDEWQ